MGITPDLLWKTNSIRVRGGLAGRGHKTKIKSYQVGFPRGGTVAEKMHSLRRQPSAQDSLSLTTGH